MVCGPDQQTCLSMVLWDNHGGVEIPESFCTCRLDGFGVGIGES